jgi:hypothetical protein
MTIFFNRMPKKTPLVPRALNEAELLILGIPLTSIAYFPGVGRVDGAAVNRMKIVDDCENLAIS